MPKLPTKTDYDGLPNREFLLLTEYISWALDGIARTDDEVTQLRAAQYENDQKRWWDCFGPGWLRSNLDLIRNGKSWPLSKNGNSENDAYNSQVLTRARNWLEKSGLSVDEALADIDGDLAQRASEIAAFKELESHIWSEAAAGHATLWARRWNDKTRAPEAEYGTIPASFFLRRATFSCGNGYHGKGELARWPDDDSEQGLLDSVFNKNDPPITFVEVKISRSDAIKLHEKYRARQTEPENPESAQRAKQVLERLWWPWDTAVAAVYSSDRDFLEAIAGRPDPGQLCMLNLLTTIGAFSAGRYRTVNTRFNSTYDAWHALRQLISDGKVQCRGNEVVGPRAKGAIIHPEEVGTLEPIEVRNTETWLCVNGNPSGTDGAWQHFELNRDDLMKHLAGDEAPVVAASQAPPPSSTPGPKSMAPALQSAANLAFPKTCGKKPEGLLVLKYRDMIRQKLPNGVNPSDKTFKNHGF